MYSAVTFQVTDAQCCRDAVGHAKRGRRCRAWAAMILPCRYHACTSIVNGLVSCRDFACDDDDADAASGVVNNVSGKVVGSLEDSHVGFQYWSFFGMP